MPMLGYRYLTAALYGIIVKVPDTINGLVMAREKFTPLLLFTMYRVEVKVAGNAEKIPPNMGPPIWLNRTASETIEPAKIARPTI